MKEYKLVESAEAGNLPMVVNTWTKVKNFLCKELDFSKPIVLEMTAKEEKVLTEVHDFLFQEIKFPELHDFFFQEINIFGWFKKKYK
jgi:hypothetical protein